MGNSRKKISQTEDADQKILLLGTGNDGKSTILKQIQYIYGDTNVPSHTTGVVLVNLIECITHSIQYLESRNIKIKNQNLMVESFLFNFSKDSIEKFKNEYVSENNSQIIFLKYPQLFLDFLEDPVVVQHLDDIINRHHLDYSMKE
jgi:GTPase SAR1 family protein